MLFLAELLMLSIDNKITDFVVNGRVTEVVINVI